MRVVFRADASLAIGTGHVMRCLALAESLRTDGAECLFVSRAHDGNLLALTAARGFETHALPAPEEPAAAKDGYAEWLGVDPTVDAQETLGRLGDEPIDWLIVDHYALDASWERRLRQRCRHIMVIDDLVDRPHDCDALLDQNLGRTPADYVNLVPASCQLMTGPGFALLRPEFAALREQSLARRTSGRIETILVTMGGVDRDNATGAVLDALRASTAHHRFEVAVVMGSTAPSRSEVMRQAMTLPFQAEVLIDVSNMAELMRDADLAIGAAGSTSWERCCLGLPSIQLILAENQRPIAASLADAGAAVLFDRADLIDNLPAFLDRSKRHPEIVVGLSQAAAAITDGRGLDRVRTAIEERIVR